MKKILLVTFLVDLVLFVWRVSNDKTKIDVLSFVTSSSPTPGSTSIPTPTITPTPKPTLRPKDDRSLVETPTPTLLPSPTLTPTSTPIPSPTSIPQPQFSQEEIYGFIERFAAQYSVDPNVLRYIATCESGFNASATNAGYVGLFQFGISSWKSNRMEMGEDSNPDLRFNAEESAQTAAFAVSRGTKDIWPNCFP